jgi:hypothetical protein
VGGTDAVHIEDFTTGGWTAVEFVGVVGGHSHLICTFCGYL